ncbi:MAG: SUMF1/EgtB/PvdO family nonheme iron enzyme [Rhodospirillaceae bacterium]|nr:SUMF1/EgtB/PvdO family nonheme iron enzyme [Rhodospirillaceae bacterium]
MKKKLIATTLAIVLTAASADGAMATQAPLTVPVNAGPFIMGSDRTEREIAYRLDEAAYGHSRTRQWKWYEDEPRREIDTGFYEITVTPITNQQYLEFVIATGHATPDVDRTTWKSYKLIHPYPRTRRHAWKDGRPPNGRLDHPVVLVSHDDAKAYARWLSKATGQNWRLPTELEWEKAARGEFGGHFPWGNGFDPTYLNSHDAGPFDTKPVGRHFDGISPFGLLDAAGQVFEWTGTSVSAKNERYFVKGGSWDDKGCGVCRSAARHSRPAYLKHILVGFRLVRVPSLE